MPSRPAKPKPSKKPISSSSATTIAHFDLVKRPITSPTSTTSDTTSTTIYSTPHTNRPKPEVMIVIIFMIFRLTCINEKNFLIFVNNEREQCH